LLGSAAVVDAAKVRDMIGDQFFAATHPTAALIDSRQQLAVGNSGASWVLGAAYWAANGRRIYGSVHQIHTASVWVLS
jgi:hypothetical protein